MSTSARPIGLSPASASDLSRRPAANTSVSAPAGHDEFSRINADYSRAVSGAGLEFEDDAASVESMTKYILPLHSQPRMREDEKSVDAGGRASLSAHEIESPPTASAAASSSSFTPAFRTQNPNYASKKYADLASRAATTDSFNSHYLTSDLPSRINADYSRAVRALEFEDDAASVESMTKCILPPHSQPRMREDVKSVDAGGRASLSAYEYEIESPPSASAAASSSSFTPAFRTQNPNYSSKKYATDLASRAATIGSFNSHYLTSDLPSRAVSGAALEFEDNAESLESKTKCILPPHSQPRMREDVKSVDAGGRASLSADEIESPPSASAAASSSSFTPAFRTENPNCSSKKYAADLASRAATTDSFNSHCLTSDLPSRINADYSRAVSGAALEFEDDAASVESMTKYILPPHSQPRMREEDKSVDAGGRASLSACEIESPPSASTAASSSSFTPAFRTQNPNYASKKYAADLASRAAITDSFNSHYPTSDLPREHSRRALTNDHFSSAPSPHASSSHLRVPIAASSHFICDNMSGHNEEISRHLDPPEEQESISGRTPFSMNGHLSDPTLIRGYRTRDSYRIRSALSGADQYPLRGGGGRSSREGIQSRLEDLNARSRVLRDITYRSTSPSSFAAPSNTAQPSSLMDGLHANEFTPSEKTSKTSPNSKLDRSCSSGEDLFTIRDTRYPPQPLLSAYAAPTSAASSSTAHNESRIVPYSTSPIGNSYESSYSPTSVMTSPSSMLGGDKYSAQKYSSIDTSSDHLPLQSHAPRARGGMAAVSVKSSPTSILGGARYSQQEKSATSTDESVDSRLEYLTRQSLALRNRVASSPSKHSQGNKKVTFEADYINGSNIGMAKNKSIHSLDEKSILSNKPSEMLLAANRRSSESPPLTTSASLTPSSSSTNHSVPNGIPNTAAGVSVNLGRSNPTARSHNAVHHPTRSLAMKILSEKILDGYVMSRNHCPRCHMAFLRKDTLPFLDINGSDTLETAKEECVICPVDDLRRLITRGVCKRVTATKLLSGEVGINTGRGLCESCRSPLLLSKEGKAMDCQVCPVLDSACIHIAREQARGGIVQETIRCIECGSPEMRYKGDYLKCLVCEVLRAELGDMSSAMGRMLPTTWAPSLLSSEARFIASDTNSLSVSAVETPSLFRSPVPVGRSVDNLAHSPLTSEASSSSPVGSRSVAPESVSVAASISITKDPPSTHSPAASVVEGEAAAASITLDPSCASQPPDLAASAPILSHDQTNNRSPHIPNPSDALVAEGVGPFNSKNSQEMQIGITETDMIRQQSLEMQALGCQPTLGCQPVVAQEIVRSPSIKSGDSQRPRSPAEIVKSPSIKSVCDNTPMPPPPSLPPVDLVKIQDHLKATCAGIVNESLSPKRNDIMAMDLAKLQEQLKAELAKAKESQTTLEQFIQNDEGTVSAGAKTTAELKADLDKAKQTQSALQQIIEGTTNLIEMTADKSSLASKKDSPNKDLLAAVPLSKLSYSISQQEVDPTGNVKEYIPPPSYFQRSNVPDVVFVYHLPEDMDDHDPSVAQSHHTMNLKRSKSRPPANDYGDCCGVSSTVENCNEQTHELHGQRHFDFDTIATDDYTIDHTLNTVDNSMLGHLQQAHSKNSFSSGQGRNWNHFVDEHNGRTELRRDQLIILEKDEAKESSHDGCCVLSCCFQCNGSSVGIGAEDDAYSMVESSKRGLRHPSATATQQATAGHRRAKSLPAEHGGRNSPNRSENGSTLASACQVRGGIGQQKGASALFIRHSFGEPNCDIIPSPTPPKGWGHISDSSIMHSDMSSPASQAAKASLQAPLSSRSAQSPSPPDSPLDLLANNRSTDIIEQNSSSKLHRMVSFSSSRRVENAMMGEDRLLDIADGYSDNGMLSCT